MENIGESRGNGFHCRVDPFNRGRSPIVLPGFNLLSSREDRASNFTGGAVLRARAILPAPFV